MHVHRERAGLPNRDRVGRELGRRVRNSRVLGARAAAVQARLDRYLDCTVTRIEQTVSDKLHHAVAIDLSVPGVEELHQRAEREVGGRTTPTC